MKCAVIDYNMGNLGSVINALTTLNVEPEVISTPAELDKFHCCILPGVGSFGDGMENLNRTGFVPAIRRFAAEDKYLFGICLGMQMMLDSSEESPGVTGLSLFPGAVKRFPAGDLKVPQINWNVAKFKPGLPIAAGLPETPWFYFVHSYFAETTDYTAASTGYGVDFSAAIGRGNCFATQFHPEKSQNCGLKLLENFINLTAERRPLL